MNSTDVDYRALESAHMSGVYTKRPLMLVRAKGARIWDDAGVEYIDCVGAQGAANVGNSHPKVLEAIQTQSERIMLCPAGWFNDQRAQLHAKLAELAPGTLNRSFLCNSGAEAVEGALKFARLGTGRTKLVATMRGFHGRTMGALSATWNKKYRGPFGPLIPGFSHVPYNNLEKLDAAVTEETAGVILEIVQGEGGVRPGSTEYLQGAQKICRDRGAMLIVDEIQTGFARTGKMFACEHYGVEPDLMTLAKSLGGGLPAGAIMIGDRVGELAKATHGSTFGGNPLVCAAALATIAVIEDEGLVQRAAELGAWFQDELRSIESDAVREVRGLGLMVGMELKVKAGPVLKGLLARKVMALPAGPNVLRFLPPLVIDKADLETVLVAVREALAELG
jgi:LysW-gamma-L-lysine/LysW-L-ornithine aminotransferase